MRISNGLNSMLCLDEGWYVLHRSGTVKSYHCCDIIEGGEISQSKEIQFEQPKASDAFHGKLSHSCSLLMVFGGALQRYMLRQWFSGYDNSGGMSASMASYPF